MSFAALSGKGETASVVRAKVGSALRVAEPADPFERECGRQANETSTSVELATPKWSLSRMNIEQAGQPAATPIQTKLAVNKPGDRYEQEADRISEQVTLMPEPRLQSERAVDQAETKKTQVGEGAAVGRQTDLTEGVAEALGRQEARAGAVEGAAQIILSAQFHSLQAAEIGKIYQRLGELSERIETLRRSGHSVTVWGKAEVPELQIPATYLKSFTSSICGWPRILFRTRSRPTSVHRGRQ